jgi:hypothetical protein
VALTYDDITAITNAAYAGKFPQLCFNANVVMARLWKSGTKLGSGERIKVPVKYAYAKSGSYTPYTVFDVSGEKNVTAAFFRWKGYHGDLTMENFELLENDGPEGVKKLLDARHELAKDGIADSMATDMWSLTATDTSAGLTSLMTMCDAAAGTLTGVTTYGDILKSTYTWWGGNLISGSGAAVTTNSNGVTRLVNQGIATIADGNHHPTLIVSSPTVQAKYMDEGINQQHLFDADMLKRGWLICKFGPIDWAADKHLTAYSSTAATNYIVLLDENYIDFISHKSQNMKFGGMAKPVDQEVAVGRYLWAGNIISDAPKRSGIIYNFTVSYS